VQAQTRGSSSMLPANLNGMQEERPNADAGAQDSHTAFPCFGTLHQLRTTTPIGLKRSEALSPTNTNRSDNFLRRATFAFLGSISADETKNGHPW